MPNRTVLLAFALLTTLTSVPASAGWWNGLHRELGLGWSDGYHAYTGCDPCEPRRKTPRYLSSGGMSPGAHYEVPSWLYGEPTPATPEPIAPPVPSPATFRPHRPDVQHR